MCRLGLHPFCHGPSEFRIIFELSRNLFCQCLKLHSREIDLRPGDNIAPHFVLTLVHGTWARGAVWMQWESPFRVMIEEELCALGAGSVTFISDFEWSGLNRHEDRRKAALKLRCRLQQILTQHPNAFHFLVGHSHAGNIILRATSRWRRLQETLCGAICIATPFLKFHYQSPMLVLLPKMLTQAGGVAALLLFWSFVSLLGLIVSIPTVLIFHWYTGSWDLQQPDFGRTVTEYIERIDSLILICFAAIVILLFLARYCISVGRSPSASLPQKLSLSDESSFVTLHISSQIHLLLVCRCWL